MTPKEKFQTKPIAKEAFALLGSEAFLQAADAALLEYIRQAENNDQLNALATGFRHQGAQGFLRVLKNIATVETKPDQSNPPGQLDPKGF
jgi:hypothetical protein